MNEIKKYTEESFEDIKYIDEEKLKNENTKLESKANETHYEVGKEIRNNIKKLGETMLENILTPEKS